MRSIEVIIPVWKPDKHRLENLAKATEFWKSQEGVSVTIRVVRDDSEVFLKQWLINKGVRACQTERFIVADMDAYHPKTTYLENFLNWVDHHEYRWAFGYSRFIYEGKKRPERRDWPEPGIQEGGIVLFTKGLWEEMGGANEAIKMLRGPDNDTAMRARYVTGYHVGYPDTIYHRWHPHSTMKHGEHVEINKGILKYTRRHIERTIALLKSLPWGAEESYAKRKSFYQLRTGK